MMQTKNYSNSRGAGKYTEDPGQGTYDSSMSINQDMNENNAFDKFKNLPDMS